MTNEPEALDLELIGDLSAFCPHCHRSLNVVDEKTGRAWIALAVDAAPNGRLLLSPRLDGFDKASTAALESGKVAWDLRCPHCGTSLVEPDRPCERCEAPVATFNVSVHSRLVPLSICARPDCFWHGIPPAEVKRMRPRVPRQKKPEQDAMLRTRNFQEVSYGFDRELAVAEASRCLQCKKPACVEGCPVGVDIPSFIKLIGAEDFAGAARVIRLKNALPAICGRVCPQDQQCERACVLGKKDEPVAIGALERFAADFERETDQVTLPTRAPRTGKRVAVVGSGPGGLTAAADLAVKGHSVTIFEGLHKAGGVLVYGIPEFRLPKAIVEAESGLLRRLGVKFELNAIIGKLYSLQELFELGYDAVFIATGAGLPGFMGLSGENLCNIVSANEYLTRVNLMKAYRFPEYDTPAPLGRHVAVIGGGNVAMDCARTAIRMGSRRVTVVYRRTEKEMPARTEEIEHAKQEGVHFEFLTSPLRYLGDDQRWVKQVECVRMKLGEPDASGRARPIPIVNSGFTMDVDMVIVAVGAGPNKVLFDGAEGLERTERGYIHALTESGRTSLPRVWAGGDIVTGSATVILAMGAARTAAEDMHRYLTEGGDWL